MKAATLLLALLAPADRGPALPLNPAGEPRIRVERIDDATVRITADRPLDRVEVEVEKGRSCGCAPGDREVILWLWDVPAGDTVKIRVVPRDEALLRGQPWRSIPSPRSPYAERPAPPPARLSPPPGMPRG